MRVETIHTNDQQLVFILACCVHSEMLFAHTVDISVGIQGSVWVHTSLSLCMLSHPLSIVRCIMHTIICMHNKPQCLSVCLAPFSLRSLPLSISTIHTYTLTLTHTHAHTCTHTHKHTLTHTHFTHQAEYFAG